MAELDHIKRRILNQAVRENVDTIRGRFSGRPPRASRTLARLGRVFSIVAIPAALFATYLLASLSDERLQAGVAEEAARVRGGEAAQVAAPRRGPVIEVNASGAAAIDPAVFPLVVRRIVLDPGHGGDNRGTESPGGLVEKELTLDIAERLRRLLEAQSFDVRMTRVADEEMSLEDRARLANRERGDIFVSIHVNWLETRTRGIETYYLGPTDDPFLTRLAARENVGAGYSLADLRDLVERVYVNARQGESQRLAASVQTSLYRSLKTMSPDLQNRGVKKAPFAVLTGTEMPAILAEVSCLSNEKETRLLKTAEYRQHIAQALYDGIESYSRALNQTNHRGS